MTTKKNTKINKYDKISKAFYDLRHYEVPGEYMAAMDKNLKNNLTSCEMSELDLRLFSAIMLSTKEDVLELIKAGANVNAVNVNNISALELAQIYKRGSIKKLLKEKGAHSSQKAKKHLKKNKN